MQPPKTARQIAERLPEVRRLVGAMRPALRASGYDSLDDLVHDVVALILHYESQRMRSRFDPARGAWTTYVMRVTTSLLRDRALTSRCRQSALDAIRAGSANLNGGTVRRMLLN